jgi:hypothetical protein
VNKRVIAPSCLILSALFMSVTLVSNSAGEEDVVPSLDCPSGLGALITPFYPSDAVAGDATSVEALENVVDGPTIDGSSASMDVEIVEGNAHSRLATVSEADGDVIAIASLEGSEADGWRVQHLEACS